MPDLAIEMASIQHDLAVIGHPGNPCRLRGLTQQLSFLCPILAGRVKQLHPRITVIGDMTNRMLPCDRSSLNRGVG